MLTTEGSLKKENFGTTVLKRHCVTRAYVHWVIKYPGFLRRMVRKNGSNTNSWYANRKLFDFHNDSWMLVFWFDIFPTKESVFLYRRQNILSAFINQDILFLLQYFLVSVLPSFGNICKILRIFLSRLQTPASYRPTVGTQQIYGWINFRWIFLLT